MKLKRGEAISAYDVLSSFSPPHQIAFISYQVRMGSPDICDGYRGLATFIGSQLDSGLGMFKRFSQLNSLNLLYMQAELALLEQESKVIAQIDDTCGNLDRQNFARGVGSMKGDPSSEQWRKVLEVREMLKAYSK